MLSEIKRSDGGGTVDLRSRRTLSCGHGLSQANSEGFALPYFCVLAEIKASVRGLKAHAHNASLLIAEVIAIPAGVAAFHADQLQGGFGHCVLENYLLIESSSEYKDIWCWGRCSTGCWRLKSLSVCFLDPHRHVGDCLQPGASWRWSCQLSPGHGLPRSCACATE
ncbi:hypothetical protein SporoS204_13780 [Sporosarcina ureae]|uniref:Uncharacterized protein n=1 Tax=Sporosarcina ureae TaxID=1571 RepID=A0ABM6JY54_SPOUR|nr:hypothetical protein SporoS204_13780 [Sporosarcina ureae]